MNWKTLAVSVRGTSHLSANLPCQDYGYWQKVTIKEKELLIGVVSDGAGSAPRSGEGAERACRYFVRVMTEYLEEGGRLSALTLQWGKEWCLRFQGYLDAQAEMQNASPRDYASTFLATVLSNHESIFFQLGDGAIVVSEDEVGETLKAYRCIFWPQQGEYENQTHFLTSKRSLDHFKFEYESHGHRQIFLFTDGLQRLALDYGSHGAHLPFFKAMASPILKATPFHEEVLSDGLRALLTGEEVTAETDDDLTLLIAVRTLQDDPPTNVCDQKVCDQEEELWTREPTTISEANLSSSETESEPEARETSSFYKGDWL